ncbi:PA2778 family cysteine peptidase [Modicisalibacter ilicicola]|uniref:PA2778 family cysteine peptidase n=1 Tax=Modicisalibacter ilicicola TaxID=480814 RepID=UPI001FECC7FD|nr:PA2778 family cysteine peptidase [Halomonas ilicicola]
MTLWVVGCASTPPLPSPEEGSIPSSRLLSNVPFHGQRDYQCGPASLAMVLGASGVPITVDELIPQVFTPDREGSVQPEMLATVRRHGRISYVLDGSVESLLTELAADHPVVVLQNLSLPLWPLWHYAVVIGYDLEEKTLTLHSGEEPGRRTSLRRFDATWARSDRWALVALPPGELPVTVDKQVATKSIAAFEQVNGPIDAAPAWRSVVARWPEHAMGWFALGNAEYAGGDPGAAIGAFREATRQAPDLAVAWLNLGLALEAQGDLEPARRALKRAAALPGRWQASAEQALARLSSTLRPG